MKNPKNNLSSTIHYFKWSYRREKSGKTKVRSNEQMSIVASPIKKNSSVETRNQHNKHLERKQSVSCANSSEQSF